MAYESNGHVTEDITWTR